MTACEVFVACTRRGIRVTVDGTSLVLDAPRGAVDAELRAAFVEHKAALLETLTADAVPSWVADDEGPSPAAGTSDDAFASRDDLVGLRLRLGSHRERGERGQSFAPLHASTSRIAAISRSFSGGVPIVIRTEVEAPNGRTITPFLKSFS